MKRIIITLFTAISLTATLLHSGTVVTAKDKLSEYDKTVQNTMNDCYNNINGDLKEYMEDNNYHIVILDEGQTPNQIDSKYKDFATGLIDYDKKMIYLQYFPDEETMNNNLYHELGHMLDSSKSFVSETNDFNTVWNNRTDFFSRFAYDTSYFTANKRECFAQMYAIYKMFPDWVECNYLYIYNYYLGLETDVD